MSNDLTIFKNADFSVRTITDENNEIWFVAKDVAEALGYERFDSNLFNNVPAFWRGIKRITKRFTVISDKTRARLYQNMLCLTEQGLYFFLGRSDKPSALPFQMWIAGEVIPSIRKHGMYLNPKVLDKLVENYLSEKDRTRRLEKELIEKKLFNAQIEGGFKTVAMVTPQGLNYLLNFLASENYPLIVLMEAQNRKMD